MRTALAPLIWGTSYLTTNEFLPPHRPVLVAVARALPAGLLLLALGRRLPRGVWWAKVAVLGALNIGVFFALLYVTASRLPGGVAAVLTASQTLLVAALAGPVLGQRVGRAQALAVVAGVVGIALVVLTPQARLDAVGVLAGAGAAVATAFGIVLTRRWGRPVDAVTFTGWQLVAGGLVLLPLLPVEGLPTAPLTAANWAGLAWLALPGGAFGYLLWFDGIAHLRAVAVSSLALLAPVTATVLGWLVAGQHLGPAQLAGGALTLAAVLALQAPARSAAPGQGGPDGGTASSGAPDAGVAAPDGRPETRQPTRRRAGQPAGCTTTAVP